MNTTSKKSQRLKRDVDLDNILFEKDINYLTQRQKRDTLNHVDTLISSTKNELRGLQVIFKK